MTTEDKTNAGKMLNHFLRDFVVTPSMLRPFVFLEVITACSG